MRRDVTSWQSGAEHTEEELKATLKSQLTLKMSALVNPKLCTASIKY